MMEQVIAHLEAHLKDILHDLEAMEGLNCHSQLVDLKDTLKALHLAKNIK